MPAGLSARLLLAARSDSQATPGPDGWQTRCLHCRSAVGISAQGEPWIGTTLEHIVPRSWFDKPKAAALIALVGDANDPRNLALACARCNHQKGRGPDARGPADERAYAVVQQLLTARLARWRESD